MTGENSNRNNKNGEYPNLPNRKKEVIESFQNFVKDTKMICIPIFI